MGEGTGVTGRGAAPARLSSGTVVAWKIAAAEARSTGAGSIETAHLLIGLLSLEKALLGGDCSSNAPATARLLAEKESLDIPLLAAGLDATSLRRRVRAALPRESGELRGRIIHRDAACKAVFSRAAELARGREVTPLHLLAAILAGDGAGDLLGSAIEGEGESSLVQLRGAVQKHLATVEEQDRLAGEVERSRATIATLSRSSVEYRRLRQELAKKTAQLALACIAVRDIGGLIPCLRDLADGAGNSAGTAGTIRQLEYMQAEGIVPGDRSAMMLQTLVRDLAGSAAGGER